MKKIYCDVCGEFTESPTKLMKLDLCEACTLEIQEKINVAIDEIKENPARK